VKLGYLSGTEIPSRAASALHVVKMCNALARLGHDVSAFAVAGKEQASVGEFYGLEPEFKLRAYGQSRLPGGGYRFATRVLLDTFGGSGFDAFYGRHPHALWATSVYGRPFAYEAHVVPDDPSKLFMLRRLIGRPNCRGIVCISHRLARDIGEALAPYRRIEVLADAADPAPEVRVAVEPWPGRVGVAQIGYVGHLYAGKGMEMVWEVARAMPEYDFHIVGGREVDIQFWRAKDVQPNIYFHGFKKHAELSGYYARLDVALLPLQDQVWIADKKTEIGRWTSPLKAFEYMAHGLPIVASDTAALREIFDPGKTALVVPGDAVLGWCEAIRSLVNDEAYAQGLGRSARDVFLQSHTWERRARSVMELLA